MKNNTSIKLKAVFLLVVFALHTAVGFPCSTDVDMDFNSTHHNQAKESKIAVHLHKHGKQHIQREETEKETNHKDNCCSEDVKRFNQPDKSEPNSINVNHPVFFTGVLPGYYDFNVLPHTDFVKDIKPFVRSYHPPIPDICIAIQSFQI